MQNGRGSRDPFDMFRGFGGFGSSISGTNPFGDPFFTRPFGSMFDQRNHSSDSLPDIPVAPIIQELISDDDDGDDGGGEMETNGEEGLKSTVPDKEPVIDHPDDENDNSSENANSRTGYSRAEGTQPQAYKVHYRKVTYGGVNGVYYTSSSTRKMGTNGVVMEECKEADKTTGEATHRISRGLEDQGHTVRRKLNSDGKVETLQTLHNLSEDELGSFDEAWNGNGGMHLPSWTGPSGSQSDRMSDWGGLLLPSTTNAQDSRRGGPNTESRPDDSRVRTRNVIRIPIE